MSTGEWQHPVYGEMKITSAGIAEFVRNFKDKVRLKLPITTGHDNGMSGGELPAIGWSWQQFCISIVARGKIQVGVPQYETSNANAGLSWVRGRKRLQAS